MIVVNDRFWEIIHPPPSATFQEEGIVVVIQYHEYLYLPPLRSVLQASGRHLLCIRLFRCLRSLLRRFLVVRTVVPCSWLGERYARRAKGGRAKKVGSETRRKRKEGGARRALLRSVDHADERLVRASAAGTHRRTCTAAIGKGGQKWSSGSLRQRLCVSCQNQAVTERRGRWLVFTVGAKAGG